MKAKTMLGLIACASACVSLSAFGNETNGWFGVTVANETVNHVGVTVNSVGTVADSKISLTDVEQSSALAFTPESSAITNCTDDIYVIGASVVLTPCSTNDFTDAVAADAKAGIVAGIDDLGATNYYGYAGGVWYKLTGASVVPPGNETTFSIVLNYRDSKANFMISENNEEKWHGPYDMSTGGASAIANIKVWGTGSISSVTGAFEVAVAAYEDSGVIKKYGSIAEAVDVAKAAPGGVAADVQAVDASGVVKAKDAEASNGLNLVVCEAMGLPTDSTEDDATIKLESATKSHADAITLAWRKPPTAEDGVTIKFQVMNGDKPEGELCDWDDIQIPMTSGTYTIVPSIQ